MRRALFLVLFMIPLACGKDHPSRPPVVEAPALGAISLADFAVVRDTLAVTVEVDRADTLFLLVDDAVVAAATEAPFTFRVSTTAFANGLRWMGARAVNAGGEDERLVPFLLDRLHGGVAVVVLPLAARVDAGATQQFTAHVLGTAVTRVIWSVVQDAFVPYPGVDVGTIDASGVYTAPLEVSPGLGAIVRATSVTDLATYGEARVEPAPAVNVSITSAPGEIVLGRPCTITARVRGSSDPRIAWSVLDGDSHGTISPSGDYIPPATFPDPPRVTIRAASMANTAKTAEVTLDMREPYRITVSPDTVTISTGGTYTFRAEVLDAPSQDVLWSVVGGSAYGTVTPEGLYTAPPVLPTPAQARVRAHCAADTLEVADALVTLVQGPPADEADLLDRLFTTGRLATSVSDQLVYGVCSAVAAATTENGDSLTLTGTLEEGNGTYTYDPEPTDRLLVIPLSGPTWEIVVTTFEVDPWSSGPTATGFFLGTLDCLVRVEGYEMHVWNSSRPPDFGQTKPAMCLAADFERAFFGEVPLADGTILELEIEHDGEIWRCDGGDENTETVTGRAVVGDGFHLTLNEQIHEIHASGWEFPPPFSTWEYRQNTVGTAGEREYRAIDVVVHGDILRPSPLVEAGTLWHLSNWQAAGTLLKNGAAYGAVLFDAPLREGSPPPRAIVDCGLGHQVVIHGGVLDQMWARGVTVPIF